MKTTNKGTSKNCGTKNCGTKNAKNTKGASNCQNKSGSRSAKNSKSDTESDLDPLGAYTGNPVGLGKYEKPVQDADDL